MSGHLLLTLHCLTSEFLFLCSCMGGFHSMFGLHYLLFLHPHSMLCQHQIPLLLPLFLLLLVLIMIWIVVLLRLIGDQELGYGFMLEIVGHDGIQESALTLPVLYIRKSREIQPRVLWGLNPKRGGTVMICDMYWSLPDLFPMTPDQTCRSWKHSEGSKQRPNKATRVGM